MRSSRLGEIVWTGDRILDYHINRMGLTLEDLRLVMQRHREALDAVQPEKRTWARRKGELVLVKREDGGAPDWATRLRAGETIFDWLGFRGKRERDADQAPAAITINVVQSAGGPNGHGGPHAGPPANGLSIRVNGGNGHGP